ncbi:MAG: sulfatase-like hydrolase/transferase, partial [Verrucomicrobiae bacterium]|nr:sulfatase-like hydrolase/transferase [Verrucomicrobiae bacterium]
MKRALWIAVLGMTASGWAVEKPNVIIVYSDDQGSVDAGCYGARDLETPNMDRLAATGVRFTQMLAPS